MPAATGDYCIVPLIGPDGAGKTTTAQAIATYVQRRDGLAAPPMRPVQVSGMGASVVDVRGPRGMVQHVDFANAAAEDALLGASRFQGALLVVSALDSVLPGTRRSVSHARELGIARMAVALSRCDLVEDAEMLDLVEMEIRELLGSHEYGGDEATVARIAALRALQGDEPWMMRVAGLVDALSTWAA